MSVIRQQQTDRMPIARHYAPGYIHAAMSFGRSNKT